MVTHKKLTAIVAVALALTFFSGCTGYDILATTVYTDSINALSTTMEVVKPSSIVLTPNFSLLKVGNTLEIKADIYPENAIDQSLTWSSSNDSVAIVENGKVTAKGPGIAIITATASNWQKATCIINISK